MGWPVTKPSTIYAIRCSKTDRVYIGRTYRLEDRVREHFYELRRSMKSSYDPQKRTRSMSAFQEDYNKHGEASFEVYILETDVPPELCEEREAAWIEKYNSANPEYGYNRLDERRKVPLPTPKTGAPPNRFEHDKERMGCGNV